MGLDIHVNTDKDEELFPSDYFREGGLSDQHSLSRTFCNFMAARQIDHKPDFESIREITGVDISPLYQMEDFPVEEELDYRLSTAESEAERQALIAEAQLKKQALEGNIDKVLGTIEALISRLGAVDNLKDILLKEAMDPETVSYYFSDFNQDKGKGYIDNNFGHDLRNFKRFLNYAKERGAKTVWFWYG
ncbi:hypothetical protein [Desertivirga arenae]|uniref:hypothetical protein n=1 Tax=Desertivirga arenae TaxID=2810309 RepID=UPI001A96524F|nr:hypothetical protein [Pedobacter sp. SYSU D00823]